MVHKRPVGQAVKTPASHAGDGSSILPRVIQTAECGVDAGCETVCVFLVWTISSVGQSNRLITGGSGVRVPDGPFIFRGIAQLVEQWSPKPRAEGSNPSAPAHLLGNAGS